MLKPECQDRHISFVANLFLQLNSLSACQNSEICAFCVHSPYHTNVSHNQYRNGCNHVIERHASVHIWRCCGDNVRFSCLGEHAGGIYFKLSDAIRIRTQCSHAALLCVNWRASSDSPNVARSHAAISMREFARHYLRLTESVCALSCDSCNTWIDSSVHFVLLLANRCALCAANS